MKTFTKTFYIMSHSNAKDKVRLARLLLRSFVGHFASIYVDRHVVYNIHSIIHLPLKYSKKKKTLLISLIQMVRYEVIFLESSSNRSFSNHISLD